MTPAGMEPTTFRFVAQHLNHCATTVPGIKEYQNIIGTSCVKADPTGRGFEGVGLRPVACWDCGFESRREAWMSVCCECCVLLGRRLCVWLIIRPEESYRVWCV